VTPGAEKCRIDKWLWHARFFKSRSLAAKFVGDRNLRINDVPMMKASALVKPGDVLTFPLGQGVRVVRILALGLRRGPAGEAVTLYEDLAPSRS
jgi:ribosome-associated heat shock protein Hsp15